MSDVPYAPSPRLHVAAHVDRYLATDGVDGFEFEGAQCVILTTVGRKTGSLRRTPLIRVSDGQRYLLVASVGGRPRHPNWYLNLLDNPEVTVQDRGQVRRLRARTATPSEKAELWSLAVSEWPDYDDYQARTDRDIPLVICEPEAERIVGGQRDL